MTLDEFTADLDNWIKLEWDNVARCRSALLAAFHLADGVTPTEFPDEGPLYTFQMQDGVTVSWGYEDGWDCGEAEMLLDAVAEKWLGMLAARPAPDKEPSR